MNQDETSEIKGNWPPDLGKAVHEIPVQHLQSILDGTAQLFDSAPSTALFENVCAFFHDAMEETIEIKHNAIYEFRRGLQPKVLFCEGSGFDSDVKHYINGMYLLDPFFDLFENQKRTGVFHFSAESRDGLDYPEFFQLYWHRIGLNNEVGVLYEISPECCIHFSVQFDTTDESKITSVIALANATESILKSVFQLHYAEAETLESRDELQRHQTHSAVSKKLNDFGKGVLTEREQMLVQLMLKGYSVKAIAARLEISPGTTSIHRSNIYRKMQVSSVGELFGIFLADLAIDES